MNVTKQYAQYALGVLLLAALTMTGCTSISYPRDRISTNTVLNAGLADIPPTNTWTILGPSSGSHCESGFRSAFGIGRASGVSLMKAFDQVLKAKNADLIADAVVEKKVSVTSFGIFETYDECIEIRGLAIKFSAK